ncbi:MAG: hypothetical protein A2W91_05350 [Bacteroidetes bacterium GWF2_38_335]|nr:MAG: hypothetical protein A2W91_05350 [Bacteroidetes bacterium GWF2_38_335]HBS88131.1 hypothetical protein [Bacteroidales bacterium]
MSLFITFSSVFSQDIIHTDSIPLKKGIYRSFYEFKFNSPSVELNCNVIKKGVKCTDGRILDIFKLDISSTEAIKVGKVFGFCDGKSVYFNSEKSMLSSNVVFTKIDFIGIFSIFEKITKFKSDPKDLSFFQTTDGYESKITQAAIDLRTGKYFPVKEDYIFDKIKDDKELSAKFMKGFKGEDECEDILMDYSVKHKGEPFDRTNFIDLSDLKVIQYDSVSDKNFENYYKRMEGFNKKYGFKKVEITESKYKNGSIKKIGPKSEHSFSFSETYSYKIGTWRYYYKNGKLKSVVNYDLAERKHGYFILYNMDGSIKQKFMYEYGE